MRKAALEMLNRLPSYEESNYVFRNTGDLTFLDKTKAWGMERPELLVRRQTYADLDADGRLDLVVNNIDAPAFVYQNVQPVDESHHYLRVALEGARPNSRGIGATLVLTAGGEKQYVYQSPYRGYMSTMEDRAHFGLGKSTRADSLEVFWPDGRYQLLTAVKADTLVVLKQAAATERKTRDVKPAPNRIFEPADAKHALTYANHPSSQVDYAVQPLLPYMISRRGPALATADVNGDGLEDVFIGGGSTSPPASCSSSRKTAVFLASTQGQPWEADKAYEDWGALFFDANGDGLPDLYVASGSYQVAPGSPLLQDRLYINRGGGRFERDMKALPAMLTSTATIRAGDFNGDGKPDLFVGGRLTPRKYPYPTRSYILRNDGGHFTDVTAQVAPDLVNPGGMITDAVWIDFDGDKKLDLVTTGEWMPINFYRNAGAKFDNVTSSTKLPPMRGWWSSLAVGDFDGDGRPDLVAGNLGLNHSYTTSKDSTFGIYASDFTGNQNTDVILTQKVKGTEIPLAGMAPLGHRGSHSSSLGFPTYGSFAGRDAVADVRACGAPEGAALRNGHLCQYPLSCYTTTAAASSAHRRCLASPRSRR